MKTTKQHEVKDVFAGFRMVLQLNCGLRFAVLYIHSIILWTFYGIVCNYTVIVIVVRTVVQLSSIPAF